MKSKYRLAFANDNYHIQCWDSIGQYWFEVRKDVVMDDESGVFSGVYSEPLKQIAIGDFQRFIARLQKEKAEKESLQNPEVIYTAEV